MRYGLDISRYQHTTPIDYKAVGDYLRSQSSPPEPFVFNNATDSYYDENKSGFEAENVLFAAYWFADPTIPATEDEYHFRQIVGSVPGALDLETTGGLSWPALQDWRNKWLEQPAERLSLDYSNGSYIAEIGVMPYHGLWYAGSSPPANTNLWQYAQLTVPGINGLVDINKWTGTDAQFYEFFGINPPSPTPPPVEGYHQFLRFRDWLPWLRRHI